MFIGKSLIKPRIETVRTLKRALRSNLDLDDEAIITISQLACLELDCAPLETVIALLRPGSPQLQHKFQKSVNEVNAEDLAFICAEWGAETSSSAFEQYFKNNQSSRS